MPSYDKTALWQQALAAKVDDPHAKEREKLRAAYENVRTRAQPLAEAIAKDLPEYTVHDITHSDALWEYADLIAGADYPLNPCEAFVLGCAFLVHDLGMGLAAYPDGLAGLKKLALWKDSVADLLRKKGVEDINEHAIEHADDRIQKQAIGDALRRLHAERADKLALIHWKKDDKQFNLIEDPELRDAFGSIIGRISFSPWWPIEKLTVEFPTVMGAQVGFPQSWTVDPLKLACLLRCADYSHVDERRAPAFLRALRQPEGASDDHWKFQAKLYQPRLEGDRLIFTAKSGFKVEEASAWWICFDTLSAVDCELRRVDSLLADTRRERFAAKGVSQAEEPSRIAKLIKTDGWQPVDTRIRVSAVADLVGKLGGKDLYGDTVTPPLREMIQNAADAVRARRLIDARPPDWGEIRIALGKDSSGVWIQVEDTGVGMSEAVLTGPLLDFGMSFWGSSLMHEQLPGLASRGFQATGRYGIGFFSVFMWGEHLEVTTQRYDKGRADTFVLSFKKGLKERPLLRRAEEGEHIPDGGTRVRVWLQDDEILDELCSTFDDEEKLSFGQACAKIAPCLDVTLKVREENGNMEVAVTANDWLSIRDEALIRRICPVEYPHLRKHKDRPPFPPLQVIKDEHGKVVGRAAIKTAERYFLDGSKGIVTVGGLHACGLSRVLGVLVGKPETASRNSAIPVIADPVLKQWAEKERDARLEEKLPPESLSSVAETVCALGVEPTKLPIAQSESGWVTLEEIEQFAKSVNEVLLVQDAAVNLAGGKLATPKLKPGVFAIEMGMPAILQRRGDHWSEWPESDSKEHRKLRHYSSRSIQGAVLRTIARAWNCSLEEIEKASEPCTDEKEFEREIGILGDQPYIERVNIIRRPLK